MNQFRPINELEETYICYLEQLKSTINSIIENRHNPDLMPNPLYINEIKKIRDLTLGKTKEIYWHKYLIQMEYAMSGDYPDTECENHAYTYGKTVFDNVVNELYLLPIDLLEDATMYIEDHINRWECVLCKK